MIKLPIIKALRKRKKQINHNFKDGQYVVFNQKLHYSNKDYNLGTLIKIINSNDDDLEIQITGCIHSIFIHYSYLMSIEELLNIRKSLLFSNSSKTVNIFNMF